MDYIITILQSRGHSLDVDNVDRLRYLYYPRVIAALATFSFTRSYIGAPVQCWMPKQFQGGWEQYVETYCLIEGSYYVNVNNSNIPVPDDRKKIIYYQWVPFILLVVAALLYVPRVFWRGYQKKSGMDASMVATELRKNAREFKRGPPTLRRAGFASSLWLAILVHKFVSLLCIVLVLLFLEYFFGRGWAWEVTGNLLNRVEWHESGAFPRVTFCDVEVREMGQVNKWTVQCVLMVNMFNEKIFFVLFWSLILLFIMSSLNLVRWLFFVLNKRAQKQLILSLIDTSKASNALAEAFVYDVMKRSGASLVQLISYNVSAFETADLVAPLWDEFLLGLEKKELVQRKPSKFIDE